MRLNLPVFTHAPNYLPNSVSGAEALRDTRTELTHQDAIDFLGWLADAFLSSASDPDLEWGVMNPRHWFISLAGARVSGGQPYLVARLIRVVQRAGWRTGVDFDRASRNAPSIETACIQ